MKDFSDLKGYEGNEPISSKDLMDVVKSLRSGGMTTEEKIEELRRLAKQANAIYETQDVCGAFEMLLDIVEGQKQYIATLETTLCRYGEFTDH